MDKYVTQQTLSDSKVTKLLSLPDLYAELSDIGFTIDPEQVKTAILTTSGETKDIIYYLLTIIDPDQQVSIFLQEKNYILFVRFPPELFKPYVVHEILSRRPIWGILFDPKILANTLRFYRLPSIQDPDLIRKILKENITLLDAHPSFNKHITRDFLEELGYYTRFSMGELIQDLGDRVALIALCHGGAYKVGQTRHQIVRIMNVPWGECDLRLTSTFISTFKKFEKKTDLVNEQDLANVYHPTYSVELASRLPDNPDVKAWLASQKGKDTQFISTFDRGQKMLFKVFQDFSEEFEFDGVNFLAIKGRTRTFNLFSLKHKWTMEEIQDIIGDREELLLDHTCNQFIGDLRVPIEDLAHLGGKQKKTRNIRKRRKTTRHVRMKKVRPKYIL